MSLATDIRFMRRCLELAGNGLGQAAPNPMVGAVLVHSGQVIGEGYHHAYGQPHAEANAIASVRDTSLLPESTLYVSLEPCSHYGKQPPCSELIIRHRIPRVVVATQDPFPKVSGTGIRMLRNAGVELRLGVLEAEAQELNRRFFTFHQKQRPYLILKWAKTLDGFIDKQRSPSTPPQWITGFVGQTLVHRWRTEEAAVMVGANTVLRDNPQLTARRWPGSNPMRMVFDRDLSLPPGAAVFDSSAASLLFTTSTKPLSGYGQNVALERLESANVEEQILASLYKRNVQSVIIEGGKQLLEQFICKELWDEARIFTGNNRFGNGIAAPAMRIAAADSFCCSSFRLEVFRNT